MGAGGISGELRDHSEHVDVILRSHFNVTNGRPSNLSSTTSSRRGEPSSSNLTFSQDVLEEMACFSCSSNFTLFRRKVITKFQRFAIVLDCFDHNSLACDVELSRL